MHRFVAALAAFAVLVSAAAALAGGPSPYASQGGPGVLARDGKTRYVAIPAGSGTAIERVSVRGGSVRSWTRIAGSWGIPSPTASQREGLSRDGRKLVLESVGDGSHSRFAVVDARTLRVLDRFALKGNFAYDALSPDASTLYLVQHVDANDVNRYIVRAYDLNEHRLVPGRIADKAQRGWVMEGWALTRATSADGRWIYTLYQRPGGYPFIHALDAVNGVAHCTGLPWSGDQAAMSKLRLTLRDGGGTLAVHWQSGRPWLDLDTTNWRLTHVRSAAGFPWRWVLGGVGGAALVLALAAVALNRRRVAHDRTEALAAPL